ncbi:TlpA family protein disulfide reductase [Thermosporothrix hazakensis]|nr:redoxin domain-containing protein [Thermosporothrix hazakensis]
MICILALWVLVIGETVLLILLLRALGALKLKTTPIEEPEGLKIGTIAPSFVFQDGSGNENALKQTDGRRRMLLFLRPGCPACVEAIRLAKAVQGRQEVPDILLFGLADAQTNKVYAREQELQIPLLTPVSPSCDELYAIRSVPFAFVVDEQRQVLAKGVASHPLLFEQLLTTKNELVASSL